MHSSVKGSVLAMFCLVPMLAWGDCTCREPARPELPPEKPTAADMSSAGSEVTIFVEALKKYRDCLVKCVRDAERNSNAIVSEWNELVEKFNAVKSEK